MKQKNRLILLVFTLINIAFGVYFYFVNPDGLVMDYTGLYFTFLILLILLTGFFYPSKMRYIIPLFHFTLLYIVFIYFNFNQLFANLELALSTLLMHGILMLILAVGYLLLLVTNKLNTFVSKVVLSVITLGAIASGAYFSITETLGLMQLNLDNIVYYIYTLVIYLYFLQIVVLYWLTPKNIVQFENVIEDLVLDEVVEEVVIETETEELDQESLINEIKAEIEQEEIKEEVIVEDKEVIVKKTNPKQKETFIYNEEKEKQQIMKRYERMYKEGLVTKEELNKIRRENGFDKV
ncbi:MAG: hypothetical protein WCY22_00005 [Acholeplasmataceae bacterium]